MKRLRITKLDWYIIKSFLLLFAGTFFICLFILMLQFLWRYVDELIGKGLAMDVFAQFFFLSALTLIPLSLPLAILLSSLMTFGNLGEKFELLSMKTAGIPLLRIIRPLVMGCTMLAVISLYFQNVVSPKAQLKLWTLLVSMRQTSPELDIPEGVFYDEIEGYNIYVKHKDKQTGILRDVLIYNFSDGFENAHVIWASEGQLEMTEDKKNLILHLYSGEQFENLKSQSIAISNVPYRRETFREKHILIDFDTNFNMVDGAFLSDRSDGKSMSAISRSIDSLSTRADSVGLKLFKEAKRVSYTSVALSQKDSMKVKTGMLPSTVNIDSIFNTYSVANKQSLMKEVVSQINTLDADWQVKSKETYDADEDIRIHRSDWHKKFTLSLACIIFFFIGAPLGAIIRKGGLGLPVVMSVIIFVLYYIVDTGSIRLGKSGGIDIMLGTWMSTLLLAPLGAFFTYKSNNDSVVFNKETYLQFFRAMFAIRSSRHITRKEVIIEDPDYPSLGGTIDELTRQCTSLLEQYDLLRVPNYFRLFFVPSETAIPAARLYDMVESVVEELGNSKINPLLIRLNDYPIVTSEGQEIPFRQRWMKIVAGLLVPIGLALYFRIWFFRLRLHKDCKRIISTNNQIKQLLPS